MTIDNVQINAELTDILSELQAQLAANEIPLIQKFKETGADVQIPCPYHKGGQERRMSAGIRKTDGLFHCFTCDQVHSLQEVVSHCFGHEDAGLFGWQWLLKNFGTVEKEERKNIDLDFTRTRGRVETRKTRDRAREYVSEKELDSYRYYHPYMYKRRLNDAIIVKFDVGYDKHTRCITFPVRDISGRALFIARRSVDTKYFNYPQGAEKPLYGLYELTRELDGASASEVIVCESMLDALTAWVYGKYAVALNGLGNDLQFRQLEALPTRVLVLATDNDEAGQRARTRIRDHVKNKIIQEYIIPDGKKDLNDLSQAEFDAMEKIF